MLRLLQMMEALAESMLSQLEANEEEIGFYRLPVH
jgi:hypothetical protein